MYMHCLHSLFCQLPNCNLFTQHVIYLHGETPLVNCGPRSIPLHSYYRLLSASVIYFLANKYLLPHDTFTPLFTANQWDWQHMGGWRSRVHGGGRLGTFFLLKNDAGTETSFSDENWPTARYSRRWLDEDCGALRGGAEERRSEERNCTGLISSGYIQAPSLKICVHHPNHPSHICKP
jgi:hypothetical protein